MVGYITENAGTNYTPTPEGAHIMVCARIVDLGTQPGSGMYPQPKRKLRIFWELPEARMTYTDKDGKEQEGPVLHSEQYTVSFNEKATLRKHLESWRGQPFTAADFAGPPNGFHLSKLIGIPALGQIVHQHKDGNTYANLNSIMRPRKPDFDAFKGKIEGPTIFFDLDDFKQEEFDKLSPRLQETIKNSPEYMRIRDGEGEYKPGSENPGAGLDDPFNGGDDVPF